MDIIVLLLVIHRTSMILVLEVYVDVYALLFVILNFQICSILFLFVSTVGIKPDARIY